MPLYEYRCQNCQYQCEKLERIDSPLQQQCPQCDAIELKRLISMTNFKLEGSGWYATDFKSEPGSDTPQAASKTDNAKDKAASTNTDDAT